MNSEMMFTNPAFEGSPTTSQRSQEVPAAAVAQEGDHCVEIVEAVSSVPQPEIRDVNEPREMDMDAAVCVRGAFKSYHKENPILTGLNMTVPAGSIYSLLGSSGCGKTTMLSCCVGIKKLDQGDIRLFGCIPGTKESGVPGRKVGFMPQELSLYNELTIQEALNFYGRIYGMMRDEIRESTAFLVDFLDLPPAGRRIETLSGGQKRRVSMALTLIHDPELLILDEPTVGVDPLLRESIWNHLVNIVRKRGTTVIITTHYVDEARQSDVIGIMRNGRLLAEKSPSALISEFRVAHLEEIVLTLCRLDREEKKKNRAESAAKTSRLSNFMGGLRRRLRGGASTTVVEESNEMGLRYESSQAPNTNSEPRNDNADGTPQTVFDSPKNGSPQQQNAALYKTTSPTLELAGKKDTMNGNLNKQPPNEQREQSSRESRNRRQSSTSIRRLYALLVKNFIILMRNLGFLGFVFLVPAMQVVLICLTIGSDPKGLLLSVVNPETCDFQSQGWRNITQSCPVSTVVGEQKVDLSCFYLAHLPNESFILESINTTSEAIHRIHTGYTYGYVEFPKGYTKNALCRFGAMGRCGKEQEVYDGSNIMIELDMSNKQIGQTMKRIFVETYGLTIEKINENCKTSIDPRILESVSNMPYIFKKPLYGKDDTSFREFLAPSILLGLLFFFPLCSSGVSYITEKRAGTLDRALVAGVGTAELMGGFLISQVGILLGQAGFAFIILTQVFKIEILGSITLALALTIMVGVSGMSAGFLIAMFCTEEVQAVLLAIGTFFPNILLAGMVWPLEGMAQGLQYLSYMLPCTLACESMRSIINRGWGLTHRNVWPGFVSTIAWIVIYWVLAIIARRVKSKG